MCFKMFRSASICMNTYCGFPSAIQVRSKLSPSLVKPSGYVTTIFTSGLSEKTQVVPVTLIITKLPFKKTKLEAYWTIT